MTYQELFIDNKDVLIIHKSLANILGDLNEAVVLNQLNYWIERYKETNHNFKDGKYWVYNSYKQWAIDNFPFWSETTVKRTFTRLENKGIVISANYNKMSIDKTKWYSIDYKKLQEFIDNHTKDQNEGTKDHKDQSIGQNDFSSGHNEKAIPENTTDITTRDYNTENIKADTSDKSDVKAYTPSSKKSLPVPERKKAKSELLELEKDMVKRFSAIGSQYDVSGRTLDNINKAFRRYIARYSERTGKVHPILKDDTLEKIFVTIATVSDTQYGHFENVADYEPDENGLSYLDKIVDEHFMAEHGEETDYHITHFANGEYLEKMARHIVEW